MRGPGLGGVGIARLESLPCRISTPVHCRDLTTAETQRFACAAVDGGSRVRRRWSRAIDTTMLYAVDLQRENKMDGTANGPISVWPRHFAGASSSSGCPGEPIGPIC